MSRAPRCDVLNLEYASSGRDIDIVEPVLSFLELRYGLSVVRDSVLDFESKLLRYRPRLFLISNEVGAAENALAVKLAHNLGIRVVTLISEGDYPEDREGVEAFFWGWNRDRAFYPDLHLEWSDRAVDLIHRYIPHSETWNIKVAGATAFDRFKLLRFMSKEDFLAKFSVQGSPLIVGLAGWGFDLIFGSYFEDYREEVIASVGGPDGLEIHRRSKDALRRVYRELIERNPDVTFVLKFHPGCVAEEHTEFFELGRYPNVVAIRKRELSIADTINASDLWIAYESTSCLEAWMLGKQTALINPVSSHFKRSRIAAGSPVYATVSEAQAAIDAMRALSEIPGFGDLAAARSSVASQVIGWDDGLNHMRAARLVHEVFRQEVDRGDVDRGFRTRRIVKGTTLKAARRTGVLKLPWLAAKFQAQYELEAMFDPAQREMIRQTYQSSLRAFHGPSLQTA